MTESAFRARDIGLRAQKKILSRMAGKNIAKAFIDETTASLLDNLYRLAKQYVSELYNKPFPITTTNILITNVTMTIAIKLFAK